MRKNLEQPHPEAGTFKPDGSIIDFYGEPRNHGSYVIDRSEEVAANAAGWRTKAIGGASSQIIASRDFSPPPIRHEWGPEEVANLRSDELRSLSPADAARLYQQQPAPWPDGPVDSLTGGPIAYKGPTSDRLRAMSLADMLERGGGWMSERGDVAVDGREAADTIRKALGLRR